MVLNFYYFEAVDFKSEVKFYVDSSRNLKSSHLLDLGAKIGLKMRKN